MSPIAAPCQLRFLRTPSFAFACAVAGAQHAVPGEHAWLLCTVPGIRTLTLAVAPCSVCARGTFRPFPGAISSLIVSEELASTIVSAEIQLDNGALPAGSESRAAKGNS